MRCVTHEASTSDAWTSFEEAMGGSTMGCLGALLHATNKQNPISKDSEGTSLGGGDILFQKRQKLNSEVLTERETPGTTPDRVEPTILT